MRIPLLSIPERALRTVRDAGGPTLTRVGSTALVKAMEAGTTAVGLGLGVLQRFGLRGNGSTPLPEARAPMPPVAPPVPEPEPTPPVPPLAAAVGAPGAASDIVEEVRKTVATADVGGVDADDLPLDDYDHLSIGSLRARLPRLEVGELIRLVDYEKAHANRLSVVTMLENRIAKVRAAG